MYGTSLNEFMTERVLEINELRIKNDSKLDSNDRLKYKEAYHRVNSIIYYSKRFNDMYFIHPGRVAKDLFAIPSYETSWVNYKKLDNGLSFGWISMRYDTAKWIADKNNWKYNKDRLLNNPYEQGKYLVWYYYYALDKFNGDRYKAIISYNVGLSRNLRDKRWRSYFFNVYGRIKYQDLLIQKNVDSSVFQQGDY